MLSHLSMYAAQQHYFQRKQAHESLLQFFVKEEIAKYANLALGINDPSGNYSAAEHHLGARILNENSPNSVFKLARSLYGCNSALDIPKTIRAHSLKYLKISIGSEMAMMLRPDIFWVANVRTVWAHLLIKHGDNYKLANEELQLYRDADATSEMEYRKWEEIYNLLEISLVRLHDLGIKEALRQKIAYGDLKYLWADAVANALYDLRTER